MFGLKYNIFNIFRRLKIKRLERQIAVISKSLKIINKLKMSSYTKEDMQLNFRVNELNWMLFDFTMEYSDLLKKQCGIESPEKKNTDKRNDDVKEETQQ